MEEIKVGEYVRTKSQGIFRISHINSDIVINEFSRVCLTQNEKVGWGSIESVKELKHSPNIIDLIEAGDYVNGHLVTDIQENVDINGYKYMEVGIESDRIINRYLKYTEIESIVTHEQFESMKYHVGGKEE